MENKEKIVFETFRQLGFFEQHTLTSKEPNVVNGSVSFRKYRVTFELVEEPQEVLAERLQKLWDKTDNYHNWTPLKQAAKKIGYELQGSPGTKK